MKLARALKLKNKISGEIARISTLLSSENVQTGNNSSKFKLVELVVSLRTKREKLVALKTGIAKANVGIWETIFKITEAKGQITFLRQLNTREGEYKDSGGYGDIPSVVIYKPFLNKLDVETQVNDLESEIDLLQEKVDHYNQITEIDFAVE